MPDNQESKELLPCPCCAWDKPQHMAIEFYEGERRSRIWCPICDLIIVKYVDAPGESCIERVVNAWNTRAPSQQLTTTQQALANLESDNQFLEEHLAALKNKLGDNCSACSYDNIEDVCMAHTPKLKQAQQALDTAREALKFYADRDNYCGYEQSISKIDIDAGQVARAALASIKE